MPHTVFTRDAGGGIFSSPVPENFVDFGAFHSFPIKTIPRFGGVFL